MFNEMLVLLLLLMNDLLFVMHLMGRAYAAITHLDVYRRSNGRAVAKEFLGIQDRRRHPCARPVLARNRHQLLRPLMNIHTSLGIDGDHFNLLLRNTASKIALPRR